MAERAAALLALWAIGCGAPRPVDDRPAPRALADGGEEPRPDLSRLPALSLVRGVPVALPGTGLTVTLVDWWYGERVTGERPAVTASAELTVTAADGRRETALVPFFRVRTVGGARLYLDGTRSAVFLFVLPAR